MPCLYHNTVLCFWSLTLFIILISPKYPTDTYYGLHVFMSESEWKTVSFVLYTLVLFFFSSLIASIYLSCLWGFLHGFKATEWLAMRFLVVCACWCCWGDSMGHEWLELRQRRAESAWGACAVHHNVQQVRWGCFSRDVNSFQEWKTSNIILLIFTFYLIGLLCFGIEKYWCRRLYI